MLYFANVYLFIFLWPPYSPALVNESSRKFYTWWTLSVIREVTTWIFSWSSLNDRVGQKVTKFGVFSDPTRKLTFCCHARMRQNIVILKKKNLLSTDGCSTRKRVSIRAFRFAIRIDSPIHFKRIYSFCKKKSAFRFTTCPSVFLAYLLQSPLKVIDSIIR